MANGAMVVMVYEKCGKCLARGHCERPCNWLIQDACKVDIHANKTLEQFDAEWRATYSTITS